MIQLDKREAFPFSSNPFGLVYENAITENKEIHQKTIVKINDILLLLLLFLMEQLKNKQLDFMDKDLLKKDILQLSLIACFLVKVKECQDNKIFLIIA